MKNILKNTNLLFIFLSFFMVNLGIVYSSNAVECDSYFQVPLCISADNDSKACSDLEDYNCVWLYDRNSYDPRKGKCARKHAVRGSSGDIIDCVNGQEKKLDDGVYTKPKGSYNFTADMSDLDLSCEWKPVVDRGEVYHPAKFNRIHGKYYTLDSSRAINLDDRDTSLVYNGKVEEPLPSLSDPETIYLYSVSGPVVVTENVFIGWCEEKYPSQIRDKFYITENWLVYVSNKYFGAYNNPNATGSRFRDNLGGVGSGLGINIPNSKYPDKVINPYK